MRWILILDSAIRRHINRSALFDPPPSTNRRKDPANGREALIEAELDEKEGADMMMVKPGKTSQQSISTYFNYDFVNRFALFGHCSKTP
jgi:hypothetical protein